MRSKYSINPRWMFLCIYLLIGATSLFTNTHASPTVDSVRPACKSCEDNGVNNLMLLADPSGRKLIEDVIKIEDKLWVPSQSNVLKLNYSQMTSWVRINLRNDGPEAITRILEIDWPMLDYLDVYLVSHGVIQQSWNTGDQRPVESRPLKTRSFAIPVEIAEKTSVTLMMRIALRNGVFDSIPVRLWEPTKFLDHQNDLNLLLGLFFGAGVGLLLFNALLAVALQEKLFFYYVSYLSLFILWQIGYFGFGGLYLWPTHPAWNNYMNLVAPGLVHLGATLFVTHYLETNKNAPWLHWSIMTLTSFILVLAGFSAADVYGLNVPTENMFILYFASSCAVLVLYLLSGIIALYRGQKNARYFLLGWSMLILGALIEEVSALPEGYIDRNILTENSLNIGVTLEFIFLALALGDRYRLLRDEKHAIEQKALALATNYSSQLERQVKERTLEMEEMMVQVNNALEIERDSSHNQREFFHSISHELRTPIAIIDTIAQNLLLGTDADDQDRLKKRYENIAKSTLRLIRVFDELLDEDQIVTASRNLTIQPCDPRKLLQDAAEATAIFATDTQVRIENFFIPKTWDLDQALIKIVLRSLTDNAIKYTPSGGKVVLSGGHRRGKIWFEVFNSGPGIDPDDLEHLFEKGYRGKNVGDKPGTGYGLALSKNAIEKHGGELKLSSIPGRGTRVRIWLS